MWLQRRRREHFNFFSSYENCQASYLFSSAAPCLHRQRICRSETHKDTVKNRASTQTHIPALLQGHNEVLHCFILLSACVSLQEEEQNDTHTTGQKWHAHKHNSATYSWEEHISHYSTMCTTGNNSGENRTKMSQGELSFHFRFFCATQEQQEQETCILMFWLTCLINEHHSFFYSSL